MEAELRSSGHYGPAVSVPADADIQTRLLAFIGRAPVTHGPLGRPRSEPINCGIGALTLSTNCFATTARADDKGLPRAEGTIRSTWVSP